MKKVIVGFIGIALFFAFIKFFLVVGGIASLGFLIYFTVKAHQDSSNRNKILKTRVLPSVVAMFLCFGMVGSLSNNSGSSHHEAASSSKVEHHKHKTSSSKKDSESSDKEDSDGESEDDIDSSSSESEDTSNVDDESKNTSSSVDDDTNDSTTGNDSNNHGDMETDQQGTIVGNSRTMVYHTPDQHGYRMNSANAVYFKSEADAQAAGYRKSLK